MKGLQNNPLGILLLGVCGVLLAIAIALYATWSRPVAGGAVAAPEDLTAGAAPGAGSDLGPFGQYRVVDDRPLFSETRRPVIESLQAEVAEAGDEPEQQDTDPPEVYLTGVVITPEAKLATLTPVGGGEAVLVREGGRMQGEHEGWTLVDVWPRKVRLEAGGGRRVQLDLMVHDQKIKEPPRPVSPPAAEEAAAEDGSGEPMSRAEEIRQRIAERREQLREQAAANRAEAEQPPKNDYQAAIQRMLQGAGKTDEDDDGG